MARTSSDPKISRKARSLLRRVQRVYESAQPLMDSAIEQNAREVMRKLPIVTEYLQSMGTWYFTVTLTGVNGKPYYKGTLSLGLSDENEIQSILDHHDEHCNDKFESGDVVCVDHYQQLRKLRALLAGHGEMMSEFSDMFGDGLNPRRFTAEGPKVTDW